MRRLCALLGVFAMASCDSGDVPPPGSEPFRPAAPVVAEDEVLLRIDGLNAGAESFYYAAGQAEVRSAVADTLGQPGEVQENAECGAGPMEMVRFGDGLTVNFQNGSLVGWTVVANPEGAAYPGIRLDGSLQIADPRSEAESMTGFVMIEDSTLGEEFAVGNNLGGFFEEDRVGMLYAGTQCFFR